MQTRQPASTRCFSSGACGSPINDATCAPWISMLPTRTLIFPMPSTSSSWKSSGLRNSTATTAILTRSPAYAESNPESTPCVLLGGQPELGLHLRVRAERVAPAEVLHARLGHAVAIAAD